VHPAVLLVLMVVVLVLLLRAVGSVDPDIPSEGISEGTSDEPILAVKRAHIRLSPDGDEATLTGLTAGSRYAADATASCPRGCPEPRPTCRCGFYAMRSDVEARNLAHEATWARRAEPLSVRLDVELSGVVLEYDLGYRAQRQRVIEVGIPDRCVPCAEQGIDRQAAGMIARPRQVGSHLAGTGNPYLGDPSLRTWSELRSACLDHWVSEPGWPAVSLGQLTDLLDTTVTWEASGTAGPVGR